MKASHRLTTISLIAFSLGLTGCASLQGVMTKFKSGCCGRAFCSKPHHARSDESQSHQC